ncbi:hypothetical protein AVEN_219390-1 [Araneus ventricosus]|uniref:Uncharacterized protein n=1 Tax=Araneus ventricosus TaxID=182803 RepID=A0A4Y2BET1_ARAVE|nr:hypothetical protein AVEN_219390-1 [Araneus ventricosus]
MGVVNRQTMVIAMLLGKTHEKRNFWIKKFEALESPRASYAEKAGLHRSRSRSGKREQGAVALIYPKAECEKGVVKNKLQSVIDPAKIKVDIRSVRNLNKGSVVIECASEQEIQRLKEEIEKNEVTKDEMEFKRPKKFNPKIIIYNVEDDLKVEEAIHMIKEQNELKEGEINHEYIMKT